MSLYGEVICGWTGLIAGQETWENCMKADAAGIDVGVVAASAGVDAARGAGDAVASTVSSVAKIPDTINRNGAILAGVLGFGLVGLIAWKVR